MNTQESRVYLALALGFCALLVASATAFFAVRELVAETGRVDHTHQVRQQLSLLLSNHQDVQIGQRGYVLTGNPDYLQPYERARSRAESVYQDLATLVQDNPAQVARINILHELHSQQMRYSELIIRTRELNGIDPAREIIEKGEGRRLMNALRATIGEMVDEETRLLALRYAQERKAVTRLNTTLLASTLFALLVVALGSAIIHRDFGRRRQNETTISEQNLQLESRVQERTAQLLDSNEELARFNLSMVDRELRMIELKREINDLCANLGLPARYNIPAVREEV